MDCIPVRKLVGGKVMTLVQAAKEMGWTKVSEDFHVTTYTDGTPNKLVFAPQHDTVDLLDDCVYTATVAGNKLVSDNVCANYSIHYHYSVEPVKWMHISMEWEPLK